MADIENLTIAINSSTKGASTNIDKLASSLEKLKGVLNGGSFKSTRKIVNALKPLERLGNIKISSTIPKRLTEIKAAADLLANADFSGLERLAAVLQKFKGLEGIKIPKIMPVQTSIPGAAEEESGPIESGMVRTQASTESASFSLSDFIRHVKDMIANSKTASAVLKGMSTAFGYVRRAAKGVVGAIGGFFKSLGRVAFYRAIRAVLKDLVQGFKDLYGYSKANGTEFYKSMDRLTTSVTYLRNSIVAMISPLVNALAPAFDFIVDKIVNVLNWFNQLISALSGAETYTVAKKLGRTWESTFDSAGNSASGANKKIKELKRTILGFDEINKLNANNDTAGSLKKSSSPYTDGYLNMFETRKVSSGFKNFGNAIQSALQDTLTRIQLIVSGALLAVGAILTFSGANIPLGIALMAAGAIGIVTAIAEKWDGLDPKVKGTITTIGLIVGGALLALGAILAFSGANIPVGIGLMAAGALSLGFTAKMNWEKVKATLQGPVGQVVAYISGLSLLLGVVALFTGHPFAGLGLIAAGAVGLGTTAALNWEAVQAELEGPLGQVEAFISGASLLLGIIALLTGNIPVGLALMAAGVGGLGVWAAANWENIKQFGRDAKKKVKEGWDSVVDGTIQFAVTVKNDSQKWWEDVKTWWNESTIGKFVNPIVIQAKNDAKLWWRNVKTWWNGTTVGKYVNPFLVTVKNTAGAWWNLVKAYFKTVATGNAGVFVVAVKNTAGKWFEDVQAAWTDENGNKSVGAFVVNVKNNARLWFFAVKTWWKEVLGDNDGASFTTFVVNIKNTVLTWYANARIWWKKVLGDNNGTSFESFVVKAKNTALTWFANIRSWWKKTLGDNNGLLFTSFVVNVKNTALSWLNDACAWWKNILGLNDGSDYESFVVNIANTASTWYAEARLWWKNILGDNDGSTFLSFIVQVKNTATTWWSNIQKWWKDTIGTLWLKLDIRLPHFSINWSRASWVFGEFDYPSGLNVDWYAKGGILDDPILFGMMGGNMLGGGEAGKEAVLPLENHTEWMDTLASRVWETGMQNTEPSVRRDDERMIDLMEQLLTEMRKFNEKEFSAEITTNSIAESTNRMNRRAGTVVIPVN